jgi:DNA-binding NarL/FixJ family response regulator
VRVVIADDSQLLRAGIAAFVRGEGVDVVAEASDADELLAAVGEHEPDVAIVDIRMPPTQTDEGIQAAHEIRRRHPENFAKGETWTPRS